MSSVPPKEDQSCARETALETIYLPVQWRHICAPHSLHGLRSSSVLPSFGLFSLFLGRTRVTVTHVDLRVADCCNFCRNRLNGRWMRLVYRFASDRDRIVAPDERTGIEIQRCRTDELTSARRSSVHLRNFKHVCCSVVVVIVAVAVVKDIEFQHRPLLGARVSPVFHLPYRTGAYGTRPESQSIRSRPKIPIHFLSLIQFSF